MVRIPVYGDAYLEELTAGRAADLIQRQRRQINDLKMRVRIAEEQLASVVHRLSNSLEEARELRKQLRSEERKELLAKARTQKLFPMRCRRRIDISGHSQARSD